MKLLSLDLQRELFSVEVGQRGYVRRAQFVGYNNEKWVYDDGSGCLATVG